MKKTYVFAIIVFALFIATFGYKMTDKDKIMAARVFSSSPAPDGMLRISVNGKTFDIDIYEHPDRKAAVPTGYMTYEKARKACESVGKRLCTSFEWTQACTGASMKKYSYGMKFRKKICNSIHLDRIATESGAFSGCRTGEGLYDMGGNLWEWVQPAPTGVYQARGGSYRDGELSQRCSFTFKLFPSQEKHLSFDNFGARCCRDAPVK